MNGKIRIFTDKSHYKKEYRRELADILRPFIKDRILEPSDLRRIYGDLIDKYEIVDSVAASDFCVLPMSWNYYLEQKGVGKAVNFIKNARKYSKKVASWITGDYGVRVPVSFDNLVFFGRSWRRPLESKRQQYALPVFIRDPLGLLEQETIVVREKGRMPKVGFCGFSDADILKLTGMTFLALWHNLMFYSRLTHKGPQKIIPPVLLRKKALNIMESSSLLEKDFVRRRGYVSKYRDCIQKNKYKLEFLNNIQNSDFTLCIRGTGNFSARIYEALALGRIPVFVNTGCLLPLSQEIDWREYCVWVEEPDIRIIDKIIEKYYANLDQDEFRQKQISCRKLWVEKLSFSGFFNDFYKLII